MTTEQRTQDLLPQVSARDVAVILFKRKWGILAVIAVTMASALFWMFLIRDDMYEVDTKVLVKIGREQAPPPSVMGASPLVIAYRSQDVNSEMDIFQSAESIAHVVDELHLDQPTVEPEPVGLFNRIKYQTKQVLKSCKNFYEETLINIGLRERLSPREKVIFGIQLGLSVKPQKDSNVFIAALDLPYRRGSARVLNALLDQYLNFRQQLYRTQEKPFFQSEMEATSSRLHGAEADLQEFEDKNDISAMGQQETVLLDHVASARAAWMEADATRQEFAGRVERLDKQLKEKDPDFAGIAEFGHAGFQQTTVMQLAELQRERERLRMTELDSGDKIQNNRKQFQALSAMLAANLRTAHAEIEQQTEVRRRDYQILQDQLRSLHAKQARWTELKRKAKDSEDDYLLYRKKYEETSADAVMGQLQIGNVAVIERASDPLGPAGVRKTTLLGLAVLAAILAALSWVTVAEFFDQGVYTLADLERTTPDPVLAVVPPGARLEAEARNRRVRQTHDRAS